MDKIKHLNSTHLKDGARADNFLRSTNEFGACYVKM